MKPIVKKILESGLVDKATADLMEHFKMIPEGSSALVREGALKDATQETLSKLAESLAVEVEREHKIRETYLDLERIRWPVTVGILDGKTSAFLAVRVDGVEDRFGRIYFRHKDMTKELLVPGNLLLRYATNGEASSKTTILESQELFIDDEPACWQVHAE